MPEPLHLAVALDGTGWHPAAWREPDARPTDLLTARYWTDLIVQAERGLLDFVTIEDALTPQYDDPSHADDRMDRVRGRLDAVLIAARVAPLTRHIGLVPTAVVTHTEPFHLSKAIATLDYVSSGRAGMRVQVSASPRGARHFGRREPTSTPERPGAPTCSPRRRTTSRCCAGSGTAGRTTPRSATWRRAASSTGPSCTTSTSKGPGSPSGGRRSRHGRRRVNPSSPRWRHGDPAYALIAASADVGFVTPHDASEAPRIVDAISSPARRGATAPVRVFADLVVFLDDSVDAARARRHRLDDRAGGFTSDAEIFAGTPAQLADLIEEWHDGGRGGIPPASGRPAP